MTHFKKSIYRTCFFIFLALQVHFIASAHAESISLRSAEGDWISSMIFQNECDGKTQCLVSWNEGEDFLSLGIGHFIWYPQDRSDRYQESFPALMSYLETQNKKIPEEIKAMLKNGPPWKTREEFLSAQFGAEAERLRGFLKETMGAQAMFMLRRFQQALLQMIQTTPPTQRNLLAEKIFGLAQTKNGLYAMIDYLNFKGDGLSPEERYRAHGWGLFQVFYEMNSPSSAEGVEFEFIEAARKVLRRRVDNAPSERQEERWVKGWENRLETYSASADLFKLSSASTIGLRSSEAAEPIKIVSRADFAVKS